MIHLTKLNGTDCVLNADLIESLESTPDTMVTLTTGHKFNVLERPEEVVSRVVEYRRNILKGTWMNGVHEAQDGEER
jgi:flagellar protein FlbD